VNGKRVVFSLALTAVFNTVIAVFLTHLSFGHGFTVNLIFSQAIGLFMCGLILAGHLIFVPVSIRGHVLLLAVSMPVGAIAGAFTGAVLAGFSPMTLLAGRPAILVQTLFISLLFGAIIVYFFFSREKIHQTDAQLKQEQIKRLILENQALEAQLKLLQAQIEPHFLFNTLSSVLSLLETDPPKGQTMLADLTGYLRSSLSRTRNKTTTLGQEIDLIRSYLDIYKVRMADRLTYAIDVPEPLRALAFAPMLAQPLVENAVTHGIEPKVEGGHILVKAENDANCCRLVVADTGIGFSETAVEGIGLSNVKARLDALYHGKGRLVLADNQPCGLKATLEIPHG